MGKRTTKFDLEREVEALRKEVAELRALVARPQVVPMPHRVRVPDVGWPPSWLPMATTIPSETRQPPTVCKGLRGEPQLPPGTRLEVRN